MSNQHPTTQAIAAGLGDADLSNRDPLAHVAFATRALANSYAFPDRELMIHAAEDGWDLGVRTSGEHQGEFTASRCYRDTKLRLIVTAFINARSPRGWAYLWAIQNEGPVSAGSPYFYPNGTASTLTEAFRLAEQEALSRSA